MPELSSWEDLLKAYIMWFNKEPDNLTAIITYTIVVSSILMTDRLEFFDSLGSFKDCTRNVDP